mgnify:CR=1 FL=1
MIPKDENSKAAIRMNIDNSFMFSGLDESEKQIVVDAMEEQKEFKNEAVKKEGEKRRGREKRGEKGRKGEKEEGEKGRKGRGKKKKGEEKRERGAHICEATSPKEASSAQSPRICPLRHSQLKCLSY